MLKVNRDHWSVESAHWILDNPHAFDEDTSLIRSGHGPENMACLRRFALSVLKHRQKQNRQPITEQLYRLRCNPRKVLDYLKLTANTRPRKVPKPPLMELPLAA